MDFGKSNAKDVQMKMDGFMWVMMDDGKLQAGAWDAGKTCYIVRTFKKDGEGMQEGPHSDIHGTARFTFVRFGATRFHEILLVDQH